MFRRFRSINPHPRLSSPDLLVARWKEDGTLDRSFDGDGRLRLRTGRKLGYASRYSGGLMTRPHGGLLATATVGDGSHRRLAAIALNRHGKLDRSFGVGARSVR